MLRMIFSEEEEAGGAGGGMRCVRVTVCVSFV